jgi:putative phosphoribosyl transferase
MSQTQTQTQTPPARPAGIGACTLHGLSAGGPAPRCLVLMVHASRRPGPCACALVALLERMGWPWIQLALLGPGEALPRAGLPGSGPLCERVVLGLGWLHARPELSQAGVGLFGEGVAAAPALLAAARKPARVVSVVACSARSALAAGDLQAVQAPTLMLAGGRDARALQINREALAHLRCNKRLEVVPGASRGFTQPGALQTASQLAAAWLETHFQGDHAH